MRRAPVWPLLAAALSGCYANVPLGGVAPEPGTRVVVELNDRGRVGMETQLGSGVSQIEGALVSRSDTLYQVGVSAVVGLRGSISKWEGEVVTFRSEYVGRMSERRFSAGRTVMAAGVGAVGFLAFVLTRSLIVGGHEGGPGPTPKPDSGN